MQGEPFDLHMQLLNPKEAKYEHLDKRSREIMLKTIDFFETRGKAVLKEHDRKQQWYADFLEFIKKERIFSTLLTPSDYALDADSRWDTSRNCDFNEILGFYGLCYWYTWQVTILGLGPIWLSNNDKVKKQTAQLLRDGGIFAFGLSEKEHGADLISSDMMLIPQGDGKYIARGDKYYIGNANKAALVSTFGKVEGSAEYAFFAVKSEHPNYKLIKNVVNSQSYVAEYALEDYPITDDDILSRGRDAWDASLATVAIGKYNLGWASIGIATHALHEAFNHASHRRLFNQYVTDFPHIKQLFIEAYSRLLSMKLFAYRASDYMRAASESDRRYLLYNPMVKMKVTMQGEEVINLIWDVIAAKGFEKDMYFEMAAKDIRGLPKLEGTVHINMMLTVQFMESFMLRPAPYTAVEKNRKPENDGFLFRQGATTKGLKKIQFHDYKLAYEGLSTANITIFKEQIEVFVEFLNKCAPDKDQQKDIDFMLTVGELFSLIVYGQLILENAKIEGISLDLVDQIFDFMVRDFSKFATQLYTKPASKPEQMTLAMKMIKKPTQDNDRYNRVWNDYVYKIRDRYTMNP